MGLSDGKGILKTCLDVLTKYVTGSSQME